MREETTTKNIRPGKSAKSLTAEEVPDYYREKFILTGYRRPYSSALQCIHSALELNNETFNIWTHLLPFFFLIFYFFRGFPSPFWPLDAIPTQFYPLLTMEISVLACHLGSTLAHTFNCMTPRIRHICFYVDYTAISMFGIGGSCATYFYLRPATKPGFFLYNHPNIYIGGVALVTLAQVFVTCASRHSWDTYKYTIRTLAIALVFICGNFPNIHRGLICAFGGKEECPTSATIFIIGYSSYIISAILNVTRVPERYFPYIFDVIGHNHQLFHITTTLGTLSHIWTVELELQARKIEFPLLLAGLSGWNTFGCILGTLAVSAALVTWFGSQLTTEGHLKYM